MPSTLPVRKTVILVVEDNAADADLVRELLDDATDVYELRAAASLAEALRIAGAVDLVLLDLNLPDSSEIDTLVAVRRACGGTCPIVVLTGHEDEELGLRTLRHGADDYLTKRNLSPELLRRTIRFALERAHLRSQIHAAQRMEAIGRLAGGIAHDFNNLLTVIQTHAWFLADALPDGDPRREDAMTILGTTERASALTQQLLTVARRQWQRPTLQDLRPVLKDLERMLRRSVPEHVRLRWDLPGAPVTVRVDRSQLEQVVMNLVVNAADASPQGGEVVVSLARQDVEDRQPLDGGDELPAGSYAELCVRDRGVGMDVKTIERMFEPFFTTKGERGTGLGLATVYGIVKQSGGHLGVYSRLGEGTEICVYLPCDESNVEEQEEDEVPARPARGERILLVENDPLVRASARRILQRFGYRVGEAEGLEDAVRLVEREPRFDVLLTDVFMPGGNGPALAERLRRDRPSLPVVLMSGHIASTQPGPEGALGADALVAKPFTAQTLLEAVAQALDARANSAPLRGSRG